MSALEKVAEMKAVAELEVQKFSDLAEAIVAGEKAAHDAGFDEGIASAGTVNQGDKIYSEEELQAELTPLKEKIAVVEGKVEELKLAAAQAAVDAEAAQIAAVEAKQAEMVADFEAAQVDDAAFLGKYKKA